MKACDEGLLRSKRACVFAMELIACRMRAKLRLSYEERKSSKIPGTTLDCNNWHKIRTQKEKRNVVRTFRLLSFGVTNRCQRPLDSSASCV